MGSSLVLWSLRTAVRFSLKGEDWIMGSHLGEEIEALLERSLFYDNIPATNYIPQYTIYYSPK